MGKGDISQEQLVSSKNKVIIIFQNCVLQSITVLNNMDFFQLLSCKLYSIFCVTFISLNNVFIASNTSSEKNVQISIF